MSRYFFRRPHRLVTQKEDRAVLTARLKQELETADAVVIGAGAGMSTSAGYIYTGERFTRYFSDFAREYGFRDMYSGGFYPYEDMETFWAYWSRYIWINRYAPIPTDAYRELLDLVKEKDYFVITTNVDHCFQRAGFEKKRLFYTQGDYGLLQCSDPCRQETFDNEEIIRKMMEAQGFVIEEDGTAVLPEGVTAKMRIPSELIPVCEKCGKPMTMNLRSDDTFVQDAGWEEAAERYTSYLQSHEGKHILFLELGVGGNTPVIIKYPFWQMTAENENAVYACLNYGEAVCPEDIAERSVCINGDIREILRELC